MWSCWCFLLVEIYGVLSKDLGHIALAAIVSRSSEEIEVVKLLQPETPSANRTTAQALRQQSFEVYMLPMHYVMIT